MPGVEVVHRPRSLSNGQSLSSLEFAGIFVVKNLLRYLCQICQLSFEGFSWLDRGVTGQPCIDPVSMPLQINLPSSSHKCASVIAPRYNWTQQR
eukprot:14406157-Ditylum_brightwellii.AAC.1